MVDIVIIPTLKVLIILITTLTGVAYMTRLGPMRVGPQGALQPIADALKLMIKEDITATRADRWVFTVAPIIAMVPALIVYAVIPFGPVVKLFGRPVSLYVSDVNIGLLYV